jgi:hypothetical protein
MTQRRIAAAAALAAVLMAAASPCLALSPMRISAGSATGSQLAAGAAFGDSASSDPWERGPHVDVAAKKLAAEKWTVDPPAAPPVPPPAPTSPAVRPDPAAPQPPAASTRAVEAGQDDGEVFSHH